MKLNLMERAMILIILPAQESIENLRTKRKLKEVIEFTEDEVEKHEIQTTSENGNTFVKMKPGSEKIEGEFELTTGMLKLVLKWIKRLSEQGVTDDKLLDLYDKIEFEIT